MKNNKSTQLENFSRYSIYSNGTITNAKNETVGTLQSNGYFKATLTDDNGLLHSLWLHRIIWQAFNGAIPADLEVCHIDDNKSNNRLTNLCLATHLTNCNMGSRNAKISATMRKVWKLKREGV